MKQLKKLASLLLALAMMVGMATTAFAASGRSADETGTITINNAAVGETYNVYKILNLESYNTDDDAYSYTTDSTWKDWLIKQSEHVKVDGNYVTLLDDADENTFAEAVLAFVTAVESKINPTYTITAGEEEDTVTFNDLPLGYYLVTSSKGTVCALVTTDPAAEINEKNETPTLVKEVQEDSDESWGKVNDADIGETVNFRITVTAQPGAKNYVVHERLSTGLTSDKNSIRVYKDGQIVPVLVGYTVAYSPTDNCTFEVKFNDIYLKTITEAKEITITFSATLNGDANCTTCGNENISWLTYGNAGETPHKSTITYTWGFDVLKYANGNESSVLQGAKFVLLNNDKTKAATIANGKLTGWTNDTENGTVLTTDENGNISVDGLDADTYYLNETEAPAGYNKLTEDVKVEIAPTEKEDGTLTLDSITAKVNNNSGAELPETGGMGTTIFYVLGGILVVGASVLLITKKRMSADR